MQPWRFFVQDRESRSTYPAAGAVNNIWGAHINLPFLWPSLRIYLLFREGPGNCRRNGSGMTEFSKRWVGPAVIAAGLVAFTTTILLAMYLAWQSEHLIFGYLIPITYVAVRYGSVPAIVTALASDLCAAYFLYPPDFSMAISDPLQIAELSFFSILVVAASRFIGGFADDARLRKHAPYKKA